ncbi:unnamed protein product, partial [Sphacelaria rigidula]
RFCPFRFLQGNNGGAERATTGKNPEPQMFGFGKHLCPGKELAKLEIILFFRNFLSEFDYELVEGQ